MSDLLNSLLIEIGNPHRPDLRQVVVSRVHSRIRELPKAQQFQLRKELEQLRGTLNRDTDAWISHQIVLQYVWHLTSKPAELTEEQQAIRDKIRRDYAESNGDWYAKGTWLTPEEVGERMEQRIAELLSEGGRDARSS